MSDFFDTMKAEGDLARKAKIFYKLVRDYQDAFTAMEKVHLQKNTKITKFFISLNLNELCQLY